jgi:hypothetical protein
MIPKHFRQFASLEPSVNFLAIYLIFLQDKNAGCINSTCSANILDIRYNKTSKLLNPNTHTLTSIKSTTTKTHTTTKQIKTKQKEKETKRTLYLFPQKNTHNHTTDTCE